MQSRLSMIGNKIVLPKTSRNFKLVYSPLYLEKPLMPAEVNKKMNTQQIPVCEKYFSRL